LITLLAGGTGSVKIIRGLAASTNEDLYIISNVGDNIWMHGLYICPDIDTVLYGLANQLDEQKGWGVKDDTFNFLNQMKLLGEDIWFKLGDKDLSTHLKRTEMLNNGRKLSEITDWMRRKYAISSKIIPASDDHVETRIITDLGDMHIQEFWVKHKAEPRVKDIIYKDNKRARAHPIAIKAIRQSKLIIIAPANPVTSIGPIVSLTGLRNELINNKEKTVAISPLVSNAAISGPAVKYMHAKKIINSPLGVAKYYSEFISKFIISLVDEPLRASISDMGIKVHQTEIVMANRHDERRLGLYLINQFR
jgi:LPPG:FO 2-phospho-L-lactate transferase